MDTLIDLNRLRADLDAKRQAFGVSWNTFAGFAGVSPAMFSRLNAGSTITLDTFARLCATCGLDPADYMPGLDAEDINDVIDMAKNRSMTATRPKEPDMAGRLEYHGTRFTLDDLRENMRAKYRNERPRFYYDTPDGTPLGYVMTLPDGGYIARLEDTRAWHAGPYDSESDAFENLFRMISRYHSVDDPPAHARGIEGPFDERKEASRLCETQATATGESLGWYALPARDAVRQTMDLADMLERRYADNPHVTISMNDTGNPVGTTDPARVEVLIDIDNGTVFTAGVDMDPNGRTHPSLMRLDGGETTKAEPLDDMRLDEKETVDLIDVRIYEAGLQGRDPWEGDPWADNLSRSLEPVESDAIQTSGVDPWAGIGSGTLPLPDPIDGPGLDRSDDPGLDM